MKKSHSRITFRDWREGGDGKVWFHNCPRNQIRREMTMYFYIPEYPSRQSASQNKMHVFVRCMRE